MKIVLPSRPRGMALFVVMIAIFVLAVLVGAFAYAMKVEMKLAMNANHETDLMWQGRSGVEAAKWVLALSMSCPYDSLNQKWAGGSGDDCETNGPLAGVTLDPFTINDLVFPFSIKIVDQERKININTASEATLNQALSTVGVDGSELSGITGSILDWIDQDDLAHINGSESEYYQSLDPPYYAKNGPIDDLSELLLVHGVTQDMYWGPGSTNHSAAAFQKTDRFGRPMKEPVYTAGLSEIFAPISNGQVNFKTASRTVLAILLGGNETEADAVIQFRESEGGSSMRVEDVLRSAGLGNGEIANATRFFTQRSSTFEVEIVARSGGYERRYHAVLRRNSARDILTLSFQWN